MGNLAIFTTANEEWEHWRLQSAFTSQRKGLGSNATLLQRELIRYLANRLAFSQSAILHELLSNLSFSTAKEVSRQPFRADLL